MTSKEDAKMVRKVRSGRAKTEKLWQAVQWAKEIAQYINKKHGVPVAVYVEKFGEIGTIRWFFDQTNMEAVEKLDNQLMADKEYIKRVGQVGELFIEGSFHDTVMFTV